MATWAEEVEEFQKLTSKLGKVVSAPYFAIVALEVALAASALPYVYAGDVRGSCGARFITHYAMRNLWHCAVLLVVILLMSAGYDLVARRMQGNEAAYRTRMKSMRLGAEIAFALPVLYFLLVLVPAVRLVANPPSLPANPQDVQACIAMGDGR